MSTMIQTIGVIAAPFFILGSKPARPEVPESLKAPASAEGILMGTQRACRYRCAKPRENKSRLGY